MKSRLYRFFVLPFKFIIAYKNWLSYFLYKILKNDDEFIFVTRSGVKLKARKQTNDIQIINEIYVCHVYSQKKLKLRIGKNYFIDIGAHIGTFSLLMATRYRDSKIYSYEPSPDNFRQLNENIKLSNLLNIETFQEAVSKTRGKIKLFLNDTIQSYSNILKETEKFTLVRSTTLEDIFNENRIDKCELLKLDCEGAEWMILTNTADEYLKRIHYIICEIHEGLAGYKLSELNSFLDSKGFKIIEIRKIQGKDNFVFAENKLVSFS